MIWGFNRKVDADATIRLIRARKNRPSTTETLERPVPRIPPGRFYVAYIDSCSCASLVQVNKSLDTEGDEEGVDSSSGELPSLNDFLQAEYCLQPGKCLATIYYLDILDNETGWTNDRHGNTSTLPTLEGLFGSRKKCLKKHEGAQVIVYNRTFKRLCKTFVDVRQDINGFFWVDRYPDQLQVTFQEDVECNSWGRAEDECGNIQRVCNKSCVKAVAGDKALAFYNCGECTDVVWVVYDIRRVHRIRATTGSSSCGNAGTITLSGVVPMDCCCANRWTPPKFAFNPGFCMNAGDTIFAELDTCSNMWWVTSPGQGKPTRVLKMVAISSSDEEDDDDIPDNDETEEETPNEEEVLDPEQFEDFWNEQGNTITPTGVSSNVARDIFDDDISDDPIDDEPPDDEEETCIDLDSFKIKFKTVTLCTFECESGEGPKGGFDDEDKLNAALAELEFEIRQIQFDRVRRQLGDSGETCPPLEVCHQSAYVLAITEESAENICPDEGDSGDNRDSGDSGDDCEWEALITFNGVSVMWDWQIQGLEFIGYYQTVYVVCVDAPYQAVIHVGTECPEEGEGTA